MGRDERLLSCPPPNNHAFPLLTPEPRNANANANAGRPGSNRTYYLTLGFADGEL
jgi:hypothetical protein